MNSYESLDNDFQNELPEDVNFRPWGMDLKQFTIFMHLGQLAGFIIPMAGLLLPIIMWVTHKDQSQTIDRHGKAIVNWLLSFTIYLVGTAILSLVFIGIPLFFALLIANFIFVIIGTIRASENQVFHYPMTINFIK